MVPDGFREIARGARRGDNPQYQLSKAEYPAPPPFNGEIHSWTYDAIGNRLTDTVNAATQNYTYLKNGQNPLNGQKLSNDGTSAYSYDFNGNTLTRTGYGFAYDAENRLTSITGNETAACTYDYQGRRTSKTVAGVTTSYLYDGLNLIAETAAGQTSYCLNGAGIDDVLAMSMGGNISYFSVDGLGSVVVTSDPAGTVTQSVVFDAWGNTKSEVGTRMHPFTYTGRENGEAGQLYYRARFYQPGIGRFTQEDPLRFMQGIHFYSYVGRNPSARRDPYGLDWTDEAANFSAAMGDSLSFGLTTRFNEWTGAANMIDKCSVWYVGGEATGFSVGVAFGGAHLARNGLYQLAGRNGLRFLRVGWDPRTWGAVRGMWSRTAGGGVPFLRNAGQQLHHWLIPQRWGVAPGITNAGFNYIPISAALNSWMNGSGISLAVEWALKAQIFAIYGSIARGSSSCETCNP